MTILTFVWLLGGEAMIAPAEAGQAGLGRGRPRAQDCQEDTAAPGLASEARERESSCQCNLDSQPVRSGQQSDRVSRSASPCHAPCHAPITLSSASVTHEPVRSSRGQERRGQRSALVRPENSPPTPVSEIRHLESVPCDPPDCQHLTSSSHSSVLKRNRGLVLVCDSSVSQSCVPSWQSPLTIDSG